MLEPILQSLREVDGVQGAMIVDGAAAVIAHRAHTIYDLSVLQQVARSVVNSIDSVELIQDDWDVLTAHFGDGKLLLRSLRTAGGTPRRYILAVIADATLNTAFLGVALRVAASKLISELEVNPNGS
jgi:predicted regulator of Ras-like GTPase activity (Roadblock/LC7/MglB family)